MFLRIYRNLEKALTSRQHDLDSKIDSFEKILEFLYG